MSIVTNFLINMKKGLNIGQEIPLLPTAHVLDKDSYVYLYYLYSTLFILYYLLETAPATEIMLALLTQALFTVTYFHSYWVRSPRLLVHGAIVFSLALFWASHNPLAIVFYFYVPYIILFANIKKLEKPLLLIVVAVSTYQTYYISESLLIAVFMFISMSINIAAERQRLNHQESSTKLQLSYEEIEHLSRIAERTQIAQDLHDTIGQDLTALILSMELHNEQYDKYSNEEHRKSLEKWVFSSRKIMSTARTISHRLYVVSLIGELEKIQEQLNSVNIEFHYKLNTEDLTTSLENIIILIIKECTTNTMRHANATYASLYMQTTDNELHLRYQDNGIGFNNQKGFGLTGIEERLTRLNGQVKLYNNNGAVIQARLPMSDEAC